jgi:hypothetical protein
MKILKLEPPTAARKQRVTVELDQGERLIAVSNYGFYRLGHPMEDVLAGHIIVDAVPVSWCSIEQKWVS